MKKICRKITVIMLIFGMCLTGCNKRLPAAPELLEPLSANESFRPVSYGDIGLNAKLSGVIAGKVVPMEYCHFWTAPVTIDEVLVSVGDTVNEGDVLATADADAVNKTIEDLNRQLANMSGVRETEENIYNINRKILEYELLAYNEQGDTVSAGEKQTEINVLDENNRYARLMYEHSVSDINEQIEEQRKILNDGTLKAKVSGKVVYSKELTGDRGVTSDENVVVVADFNDCYIEIDDVSSLNITMDGDISAFDISKWDSVYALVNGEKKYLEEFPYSKAEKLVMENKKSYPPLRFKYADKTSVGSAGETVPIFVIKYATENVLRIEKEAVYQDAEGDFVYVKTDKGKEKRYLELGAEDTCYREVISGLDEGELVYYSSQQVMPDKYDEYVVSVSNYEDINTINKYDVKDYNTKGYFSDYEGTLVSFNFAKGDTVNAGDEICVIRTDKGGAMLQEMKNSIESAKAQHQNSVNGFDEQMAQIDAEIYAIDNPPVSDVTGSETDAAATATATDAVTATDSDAPEEYVNPYRRDILVLQRQILEWQKKAEIINYEYQIGIMNEDYQNASEGNDGNGNISVRADASGTISEISEMQGKNITAGTFLFSIHTPASPCISINTEALGLGQGVTVKCEDGKEYYGKNIGASALTEKCYVTTVGNRVYMTRSVSDTGNQDGYPVKVIGKSYILMDDESFYDISSDVPVTISYASTSVPDVVVIPVKGLVYKEQDLQNEGERYYVWKIVEDTLVKTYITVLNPGDDEVCVLEGLSEGDRLACEPGVMKTDADAKEKVED